MKKRYYVMNVGRGDYLKTGCYDPAERLVIGQSYTKDKKEAKRFDDLDEAINCRMTPSYAVIEEEVREVSYLLKKRAENLSTEWNNTGFIVLNKDGSLSATVWNHWQYESEKRPVIASVNHEGWKVEDGYELE